MLKSIVCISVFCLTLAFFCGTTESQIVTDGLVSYWTFDEQDIEDNTVKDIIGINNGIIQGKPKSVDGKLWQALEFDGVGDFVEVAYNETLDITDAITVCAWIKTYATGTDQAIVDKVAPNGDFPYLLRLRGGKFFFGYWDGAWHDATTEISASTDTWYHVAGVFDGKQFRFYVDTELKASRNWEGKLSTGEGLPLRIGNRNNVAGQLFNGIIDEIGLYGRALSEAEIKRNYNANSFLTVVNSTMKLSTTWGEIKSLIK